MPVCGIVDPSHKERRLASEPYHVPNWIAPTELLETAYRADTKWSPYPYELIAGGIAAIQDRGTNISTTALTSPCPRSTVLERMEPYVADLDELWRAFRGTMTHAVLDMAARPNSIPETRFWTTIDGYEKFSGKPDLITDDGKIWDYKTTKNVPRWARMYDDHNSQLQLNRFIINNAEGWERDGETDIEFPFDPRTKVYTELVIVYMDLDGPMSLVSEKSIEVPTGPGARYPTKKASVPNVWTDEEVRGWLLPRFRAMKAAFESYPRWPHGVEELWGGPPGYGCPGYPWCKLPKCLAKRYPGGLVW